jgi:hypothetical protein
VATISPTALHGDDFDDRHRGKDHGVADVRAVQSAPFAPKTIAGLPAATEATPSRSS